MSTFIEQLKERAKKDIKTIVLAEGEEIRTLKAAEMVKKEGYAKIILVGNPDKIKAMAAAENLDIDGIKIVDSENSEKNEEYANVFYELRKKNINLRLIVSDVAKWIKFVDCESTVTSSIPIIHPSINESFVIETPRWTCLGYTKIFYCNIIFSIRSPQ